MDRPSGGWNDIPRRLKRHLVSVHCSVPDDDLLDWIFTTIALSHFSDQRDFSAEVQQVLARLVPVTRRLCYTTKVRMSYYLRPLP